MSNEEKLSPLRPKLAETGQRSCWSKLYGSSKALAIGMAAQQLQRPFLILTKDSLAAVQMIEGLNFYRQRDTLPIRSFPDWETLPYDMFSPYRDIISERLRTLFKLSTGEAGILVVPISTALHRLLPRSYLLQNSLSLKVGDTVQMEHFKRNMTLRGYCVVSQVMEHGDLAVRGSLIDIFPMGAKTPYRLDLFDNEIDTIRTFDPESQRSLEKTQSILILPAREIALMDEGISRFRAEWRRRFKGNPNQCPVYRDVSQSLAPAGIEYYLPLFYQETGSLFDYMPASTVVVVDEETIAAADRFRLEVESRYEQGRHDPERPLLPPDDLFLGTENLCERLHGFHRLDLVSLGDSEENSLAYSSSFPPPLPIDVRTSEPLSILKNFIGNFGGRILIVAEGVGRRESLLELFARHQLYPARVDNWDAFLSADLQFAMVAAPLEQGVVIEDPNLAVITESQLFGERVMQRRLRKRRKQDAEAIIKNLTELTVGAPVVHEEHGVGRYLGLVTLETGDIPAEYIMLEYAEEDKLYVPIARLNLISRFTGIDPDHAPLHKLGSGQWQKVRRKAAEKIHDVAAELLEINARRAVRPGQKFYLDEDAYQSFIQNFPFEETPDQYDAIVAVLQDMQQEKPMDRLVCGDSGFGKTEIALRAAFVAVNNNKQVAILAPTTLLANQHHQNFTDRFADWPVCVELLSRFRTKKEQNSTIKKLREGQVDIVIGTHKLLQNDVGFAQLGLVILDEEHRFGVRQKERFKSLRADINVLTLTATPIPRTLNMALSDLRELSIITTPPSGRLAVKTFMREWNSVLVKEALLREIKRGGQVFFLHNEIKTIEKMAKQIEALLPEARVRIAHGQMPEKQLEAIMLDFYHRRFNVLVCTTIIETGIDVPSANTIIINHADKFGLAQLYQLRGRIGRSHHQAYAYFVVPPKKMMTTDAIKRLEAIESLEALGVGFTLATHDLEIRGTGEILGKEQSGHIQEIGFGMYMQLLNKTAEALKAGRQPQLDRLLDHGAEIDLHIPALIPQDFLPDVHTRLIMYKRIASAKDKPELRELQEEMIDRFGLLPEPVKNLFRLTELKLKANPLGIKKVDLDGKGGRVLFSSETNIDADRIIRFIQSQPQNYRLDGPDKLRILQDLPDADARFTILSGLLNEITLEAVA